MRLLLASTSAYRRALLERLRLPFEAVDPGVEERRLPGEAAVVLASRLAAAKAAAVAGSHPEAVVIGSDQVAALDEDVLGKPGDLSVAREQLQRCSGREVVFLTAVHVCGPGLGSGVRHVDATTVRFRALDIATIDRYLAAERPFDCAGSFRCEGLGIALFESLRSEDPTALVGLPLIATARALRQAGFAVP